MIRTLPLFAVASALLLSACNPCAERCRVESRKYDECLFGWGMEWADLGAEDQADFRKTCVADENRYDDSLDPVSRSEERGLCADLNTELRAAADCDEVWEALVGYGLVE
jgi:hypothetical protein